VGEAKFVGDGSCGFLLLLLTCGLGLPVDPMRESMLDLRTVELAMDSLLLRNSGCGERTPEYTKCSYGFSMFWRMSSGG